MALTLLDFQKLITEPRRAGIVETLYTEEPIYQLMPFESISGLSYTYDKEAALPSVAFRGINEAYTASAGVIQPDVEHLKPFGGESDCDTALVSAYGQAQRAKYDGMFAKAMAVKFVQFVLYGNSPASRAGVAYDDAKGFDGLMTRITAAQTVDALGTGGSDGSSVFAIRFGDGYFTGLATPDMVAYEDFGKIAEKPVWRARIEMVAGIAIENGRSVAMIKDLRAATQVLTYTMMDNLYDLIDGTPSVFIMSKRSRRQLKASCLGVTAALDVTLDRLGNPIETYAGVPIVCSDIVIDTETNS
jgi:hypothetical protein